MSKERIQLTDSPKDMIIKLSDGNPGAVSVLMQLLTRSAAVDPDSAFGPFTYLLNLNAFGIYGPRIWMLYKDVCHEDIVSTMAVLRATQLGIITRATLKHAIDNYGDGLSVSSIMEQVKKELPDFGKQV